MYIRLSVVDLKIIVFPKYFKVKLGIFDVTSPIMYGKNILNAYKTLWVFHSLNPYMDFHQIFKICLPQEDLQLIRFWGVFSGNCCHGSTFKIFGS